ncbi:fimbrillin family protein [Parabacteroides faecis]|uniref:fimbrillin family protein n=1 Tax=Parabacteroides faecis TaxID=1217282 RepID=UPI002164752B|nr:fimbrillin family protein [Parabacteroides faecis]MCS2892926.1 fimbrillin family protein [Parabacteroides faecis]UVQ48466.1 fimbrillin family protein [Parabacteroides faecis]
MKTKKLVSGITALALGILSFTACNNEDTPTPSVSNEYVTIEPSVSGEVITKAGGSYGQTGDKLYLYYNTAGNTTTAQYADFRYDGTIWDLGANKMKWSTLHNATTSNTISFYATTPALASTSAAVKTDQSTASGYKSSDLLVAYKGIAKAASETKYTALSIDLKHALAKLTIEVNAKAIENAIINSVIVKDVVADYSVAYNASEDTPATTTVSGDNKADIKPLVNGNLFNAVLPAQTIQKTDGITIVITVNNQTYTYAPTQAVNLLQGKNTTLKLRLAGTGVILGDVTISDWGNGDTTKDNIEADPVV